MAKIVLHQWEMSPFCNKVRRCLAHKGLDFEVENYNGLLARRAAKLSQVGTLPVLDHEGERIWDSTRIAERLDQLYPGRALLPAAPRARAEVAFEPEHHARRQIEGQCGAQRQGGGLVGQG